VPDLATYLTPVDLTTHELSAGLYMSEAHLQHQLSLCQLFAEVGGMAQLAYLAVGDDSPIDTARIAALNRE
jgi:hypothetical protein